MGPSEEDERPIIVQARDALSMMIEDLTVVADGRPENGAELMLAVRHLQDARMRLGAAMAVANGENPWINKFVKKGK